MDGDQSHSGPLEEGGMADAERRSPPGAVAYPYWSGRGCHFLGINGLPAWLEVVCSGMWLDSHFVFICCRIIKVTLYE